MKNKKVFVAGHSGLFGSAMVRELRKSGYSNFIEASHSKLDLTDPGATLDFFMGERPELVVMAAGKVGGIQANRTQMADFALENLLMACSVVRAAHEAGVEKLLYLGSSCIYPPPPHHHTHTQYR